MVEHDLAKVGVASSSLVFRSRGESYRILLFFILLKRAQKKEPDCERNPVPNNLNQ